LPLDVLNTIDSIDTIDRCIASLGDMKSLVVDNINKDNDMKSLVVDNINKDNINKDNKIEFNLLNRYLSIYLSIYYLF
jgi:hypothetical protein